MNARENPFRTECVEQVRYRFLDGTWAGLMARLKDLDYRAALVGPDGSGKTTLLEELAPRLTELGFGVRRLFLNDEGRLQTSASGGPDCVRAAPEGPQEERPTPRLLSLRDPDEVGATREALTSFLAGLSERDVVLFDGADLMGRLGWLRFRRRARKAAGLVITSHRPGMLPTLIDCSTTPELLDGIIVDLLGKDYDGARERLPRRLLEKHEGNVRNALRELYDTYAERV